MPVHIKVVVVEMWVVDVAMVVVVPHIAMPFLFWKLERAGDSSGLVVKGVGSLYNIAVQCDTSL